MNRALLLLPFLCACSAPVEPAASTSSADSKPLVALRYAFQYDGGWAAVVEVADQFFEEHVSIVYRTASGAWTERQGQSLTALGDGRALFYVDHLPALEPLVFAVHYRIIFSGGLGNDFWDNNGGKNYSAGRLHAPMGPGVDVAVTELSGDPHGLSARMLVWNLAYAKHVDVVYTTDAWKTTTSAAAAFERGGGDGGEVWRAAVPIPTGATRIELAAVVEQGGHTALDDGPGKGYACELDGAWKCPNATLLRCDASGCTP
jgi:hypothetical protein